RADNPPNKPDAETPAATLPATPPEEEAKPTGPQLERIIPATPSSQEAFPAPRRGPSAVEPSAPASQSVASIPNDLDARIGQSMQRAVGLILSSMPNGELAKT